MKVAEMLAALRGMTILEDVHSGALTRAQLDALGYRDSRLWEKLAHVYFGPTRNRQLQAEARSNAAPLSLDAVAVIEKNLRGLLKGAAVTEEELRVELCALRGTVSEIARLASARVREHNRSVKDAAAKAFGKRALRGGKNTDPLGLRTITVTLPERQMADVIAALLATAKPLRDADPKLGWEQAMADAAYQHLTTRSGGSGPQAPTPMVVMALPDYATVLRQDGDDTVFALTNGTTITGKELVEQEMASQGLVGIYDRVTGGIDLYREQRFATWKQRVLLAAETIVCPYPGCTTPADQCHAHHLDSWEKGGDTNLANLTMACPPHNARNDDDPNAPPRNGRLERRPGGVVYLPPDGGPPQTNTHPIRKLSAMALINRA